MSSHHVVREAQEPALFILSAEELSTEFPGPLLEWSPTIVVCADAFEAVLAQGIKADILLAGAAQQVQLSSSIESQAPIHVITTVPEEAPLLTAFRYMAERQHRAVNILAGGLELPELLQLLSRQSLIENVVLFSEQKRYCMCPSGLYAKWYPEGEEICVIPPESCRVSTQGTEPELQQELLSSTKRFRTKAASRIRLEADGPFWLVENME